MAAVMEAAVVAPLGYVERQDERPYDFACPPPAGVAWNNYRSDARPMRIADARGTEAAPAIEREGFMLVRSRSAVRDFFDEAAIARVYYAEAAGLARAAVGGREAYVFDHLVRRREAGPALTFGRKVSGARPSANGRVHNDYTEMSGRAGCRRCWVTKGPPATPSSTSGARSMASCSTRRSRYAMRGR
jgi:hypothetical protein